jgi:hypothetical protein
VIDALEITVTIAAATAARTDTSAIVWAPREEDQCERQP